MEQEDKGGLEAIVSEKPMQKKNGMKKFLIYAGQLPKFAITAIAGIGLATSLYFGALSAYKTVDKFLKVDDSMIQAAEVSDEPSPYSDSMSYGMVFVMCTIGGASFAYALVASVKEAKKNIEEEMKKQ